MIAKEELLRLYNFDLDELLEISSKYHTQRNRILFFNKCPQWEVFAKL